jgi:hypothetical protein
MSAKRPPLDPESLSRPERSVQVRDGRKALKTVEGCGGCFCCTRRDQRTEGWGRALCGMVKPAQFKSPDCKFDPDWDRIYSRERIE